MRISTNRDDPSFASWWALPNKKAIRVLLNGVEIDHVSEADEEKGYLIRTATDENGRIVIRNDEVVTERRTGIVTIMLGRRLLDGSLVPPAAAAEPARHSIFRR